ncbi:MAG: hypothetical protein HS104_32580 [Polyangiaceae bacterium]|nr:hypothetical protein [Polyangiaceae bacterium]MBK8997771.1 hypothetical protein [Myxococcales bacterium]MCE7889532.1 hypothetical protein [Sorangiineae bacterium PRO1]MCL4749223.1 hypothetical protein [Myxococcales bacterium]
MEDPDIEDPRVRCRACKQAVIPGRFCSNCGLSLPLLGRSGARCASCAALLAHHAGFCTDCGNPTGRPAR